jgi:hypothetical protein
VVALVAERDEGRGGVVVGHRSDVRGERDAEQRGEGLVVWTRGAQRRGV